MSIHKLGIHSLTALSIAIVLGISASAAAQRQGGHGGGWSGSHGGHSDGGYGSRGGGGSNGGGGGTYSHSSSGGARSGSRYGTVHNVYRESSQHRVTVDRMPDHGHFDPHGWSWNHHDLFHDGFRFGYYHYDRWWRDDFFAFNFYLFQPIGLWVYSPWYYYPSLPPYIAEDHVTVVDGEPQDWDGAYSDFTEYKWEEPVGSGGDYTDLDYAIQDLKLSFMDRSDDAISRLAPRSGRVAIYADGHYAYSLDSNEFFDTLKDGTTGARTSQYKVLDVKTNGHDVADVETEQDYTDPWGKDAVVYQTFRLVQEGSNVVIRSFGTYRSKPW